MPRKRKKDQAARSNCDGASLQSSPPIPPVKLRWKSAAEVEDKPILPFWAGRIPRGAVTLLTGQMDTGKSTLLTEIAKQVTRGGTLPGGPDISTGRVLYYGVEEGGTQPMKERLAAGGTDMSLFIFGDEVVDGADTTPLSLPSGAKKLQREMEHGGFALLIVDPITSYIDDGLNPEIGTTARSVCQCLTSLATALNIAVIIVKHCKKPVPGLAAVDLISGSKEWANASRAVLGTVQDNEDPERSLLGVLRYARGEEARTLPFRRPRINGVPVVAWEDPVDIDFKHHFTASNNPAELSELAETKRWLREFLQDGLKSAKDVKRQAEENTHTLATLKRAKRELNVISEKEPGKQNGQWCWRLPDSPSLAEKKCVGEGAQEKA